MKQKRGSRKISAGQLFILLEPMIMGITIDAHPSCLKHAIGHGQAAVLSFFSLQIRLSKIYTDPPAKTSGHIHFNLPTHTLKNGTFK